MNGELILTSDTYDQGRIAINDSFSGTANLNNLLLDADFSGGTGGGVIYSAGTDLYNIFLTAAGANDITRVQPGSNTTTGGTGNFPTVSVVPSPSFNSITSSGASSFTTLSATTMISGSTDLYNIFLTTAGANDITRVQPGSNITTGGTGNFPTISVVPSPSFNSVTASGASSFATITATTMISGSTDLYNIFLTTAGANDITRVQPGSNITTGGTGNNPTVNLNNNIHINNISFSGTGAGNSLSAATFSGGTIFSGSTDLYDIFCTDCGGGAGFSGLSSSTGTNSIVANNGTGNLASGSYSMAIGSGTTASGFSSNAGGIVSYSNNYSEWSRSSGGLGQYGMLSYFQNLTNNSPTEIFLDGGSLAKQFVIPIDSAYYVKLSAIGMVVGGTAAGQVGQISGEGIIKNVGGTVSLITDTGGGGPFDMIINSKYDTVFGDPTLSISVTADNTNKSLKVEITSIDAQSINWFIKAEYTKVIGY